MNIFVRDIKERMKICAEFLERYKGIEGDLIDPLDYPPHVGYRILRDPFPIATSDYREERLNIHLDSDGKIKDVYYG